MGIRGVIVVGREGLVEKKEERGESVWLERGNVSEKIDG